MRLSVKFLAIMVILSMALAGCGGSKKESKSVGISDKTTPAAAPASSNAPQPAAKPTLDPITISIGSGDRPSLKHLMINLNSFGKDQAVNIEFKEYKGGSQATTALLGREIDMAILQTEAVLRDTSGELRMVALLTKVPGNTLLVDSKYKDQIKSVKDLAGKKVGISSKGSGTHQFLLAVLDRQGIDPDSITVLPVGLDAPEVFKKGEVVATVSIEPFVTQVIESGVAVPLVDARKAEGVKAVYGVDSLGWIALVTRADYIQENGPKVERMVQAVEQSLRKIASASVDDIVAEAPSYMYPGGDAKMFGKMVSDNRGAFVADGKVTRDLLAPVWKDMQEKGAAPKEKEMPFDQIIASPK